MKKLTSILIATVLLTAVTADPTGQMTYFATHEGNLYVLREGADNPIAQFDLPSDTTGLTFDGEHWWMIKQPEETIYCFDYGGDYVTDFPPPAPNPMGLAWDGEYLWISCSTLKTDDIRVYNVNLDGTPGPYPDFLGVGEHGLVIFDEYVLALRTGYVGFYEKDGSFVKDVKLETDAPQLYTYSITSDGESLWVCTWDDIDWHRIRKYDPDTGEILEETWWGDYYSMAYGTWTDTGMEVESLGKIKAFFDNESGENNDGGE